MRTLPLPTSRSREQVAALLFCLTFAVGCTSTEERCFKGETGNALCVQTSDPGFDPASEGVAAVPLPEGELPASSSLDLDDLVIVNQGTCGSCVAFATHYAMGLSSIRQKQTFLDLSPAHIWNIAGLDATHCLTGASIRTVVSENISQERFVVSEGIWPYDLRDPETSLDVAPTEEALFAGGLAFIQGAVGVSPRSLGQVKAAIAQGWPPILAVPVYENDGWSDQGHIDVPAAGDEFRGYHAVVVVSYDDATSTFRFVNSWGTTWGDDGFGTMTYAFVRQYSRGGMALKSLAYRSDCPRNFCDSASHTAGTYCSGTGTSSSSMTCGITHGCAEVVRSLTCETGCEDSRCTSCSDRIKNGGESGIDCGGPCPPCPGTCQDGIQNQGEAGIDCGGPCPACTVPTCSDRMQNQGEVGVDCGGPCPPCWPSAPTINAAGTGYVDQSIAVSVTAGVDPHGGQVEVECSSIGSSYELPPYHSGFGSGGRTVTAGFSWSSLGTKTISCATLNTAGVASDTTFSNIQIVAASNGPPGAPAISAPASATVNQAVPLTVTIGTDPEGNPVKVQCASPGSNYDATPFDSGLGTGGRTVNPFFSWTSSGTKTLYCTSFDQFGAPSATSQRTIQINPNGAPVAPIISAPASASVNQAVVLTVTIGTDPEGNQVKVQCASPGSNYDATPFDSGLGTGGRTVNPSFAWISSGTKTLYCTSFDQFGAASSTSQRTIQINPNRAPTAPAISAPTSASVNQSVVLTVTIGTDPEGNQVKVQCASPSSNYDATPFDSGLGTGGRTVNPSFTWTSSGTKTLYCTSFDQYGAASSTSQRTIQINPNGAPTAPTISAPTLASVNQAVVLTVSMGTDPEGNQVKVQCASSGSNYGSTPFDSGLGTDARTVNPSFIWFSSGTKTIYCTCFDQYGAASPTSQRTIQIN